MAQVTCQPPDGAQQATGIPGVDEPLGGGRAVVDSLPKIRLLAQNPYRHKLTFLREAAVLLKEKK